MILLQMRALLVRGVLQEPKICGNSKQNVLAEEQYGNFNGANHCGRSAAHY